MFRHPCVITNRYENHFVVIGNVKDFYDFSCVDNEAGTYDCFVVNFDNALTQDIVLSIAGKLAKPCFQWIEIFGFHAELLHDTIDRAAVASGRQTKIGDGNPMTAWDDGRMELKDTLAYIMTGGQGSCDWKLLLVIGTEGQVQELFSALSTLVSPSSG
jgi:hypothetical protein